MDGKVKYQDAHRLDIEPQRVSSLAIQKILLTDIYCDLNIEGQMHQTLKKIQVQPQRKI